jgi:hypothetical protein
MCRKTSFKETLIHCFGENYPLGLMDPVNSIKDINLFNKLRIIGTGVDFSNK